MEHHAGKVFLHYFVAVEQVAGDGVADAVEVHADLMPSAGAGVELDEGTALESLQDAELGNGSSSMLRANADPTRAEVAQRLVDHAPVICDDAMGQRQIDLANQALLELQIQPAVDVGIAGKDDHAAGFLVDAVDDVELLTPFGAEHLE